MKNQEKEIKRLVSLLPKHQRKRCEIEAQYRLFPEFYLSFEVFFWELIGFLRIDRLERFLTKKLRKYLKGKE